MVLSCVRPLGHIPERCFIITFLTSCLPMEHFVEGTLIKRKTNMLKWMSREPHGLVKIYHEKLLHFIHKWTVDHSSNRTGNRWVLRDSSLVNSKFTAQVFKSYYFSSISCKTPLILINIFAYEAQIDFSESDISSLSKAAASNGVRTQLYSCSFHCLSLAPLCSPRIDLKPRKMAVKAFCIDQKRTFKPAPGSCCWYISLS